jgi:diguanylate cyclase (GGDEF)-like protein
LTLIFRMIVEMTGGRLKRRCGAPDGRDVTFPRPLRIVVLASLAWMLAHEAHALLFAGVHGLLIDVLFGRWVHVGVMAAGGLVIAARAVVVRDERLAWALFAAAVLAWTAGEAYYTLVLWDLESPPAPSPADVGYVLLPVLALAGIAVLVRGRVSRGDRLLTADAATAALAVAAISAALVLDPVLGALGGDRAAAATNLAYPVSDLLMLAAIAGATAFGAWRLSAGWVLLGLGCVCFTIADGTFLVEVARGDWISGGPIDVGWWVVAPLWALAAWKPRDGRVMSPRAEATASSVLPLVFATVALVLLLAGSLAGGLNTAAAVLAAGALVASTARLALTLRAHSASLAFAQAEAFTDALTGLGNRRRLTCDLEERVPRASILAPLVLVLLDLDGFKDYNDAFGHPEGDALLTRLATRLTEVTAPYGSAYRIGGDEFCALVRPGRLGVDAVVAICAEALREEGEGYAVGCSRGAILLPVETSDSADALRLADQRMYADKNGGRLSAMSQTTDALLTALDARGADLGIHTAGVTGLAVATARRVGLDRVQVEEVRRAAELHDVGKVGIPDAILAKPSALDEAEWGIMRRHTLVGAQIVAAAPALARVAQLVRASHERFDGTGYPDGLAGDAIPLGARIVAVCDAFDAMTGSRPYRDALDVPAALAELRRCAGEQFDPLVVDAFVEAWGAVHGPVAASPRRVAV